MPPFFRIVTVNVFFAVSCALQSAIKIFSVFYMRGLYTTPTFTFTSTAAAASSGDSRLNFVSTFELDILPDSDRVPMGTILLWPACRVSVL